MRKYVYLAGPIMGCTKGEANDWRQYVAKQLFERGNGGIVGISPLRCEPLIGDRYSLNYPDPKFGTARAIAAKNIHDVQSCDMILAYLPTPAAGKVQSYGTMAELSWAYALNKQAILVSDDPYMMAHPVIDIQAGWKLNTLDDAIDVIIGVLGGYTGGKNV